MTRLVPIAVDAFGRIRSGDAMLTEDQQQHLKTLTRALQIIVLAMAGGVFAFAVVAILIGAQQRPDEPFVTYVAAAFAGVAFVAWAAIPGVIVSRGRQAIVAGQTMQINTKMPGSAEAGDVGSLVNLYLQRTIIAVAILEGGAFFNLVAYLLEGRVLSLIVTGVLLVLILMHVPWQTKVADWVQSELTTIEQLRQMLTYDGR
jgi:hypothetical protein